jgi:hypothetical protein
MICLDNTDTLEGSASVANVVDYTIHGLVGTTFTQLAAGQLSTVAGTVLYTAGAAVSVVSIILVNTHTAAVTVDLALDPGNAGTSRRLIPKTLSLGAGYSLHTDGQRITVMDTDGKILSQVIFTHASTHENGGADEINVAGLSGELADAQPLAIDAEGVLVGTRPNLNFIQGSNVTLTVVDDPANDEVGVTIAAAGGGAEAFTKVLYQGLIIRNNVTNPNYQVDIDANEIRIDGGYTEANLNLTVDITASGANGLDTGSEAASTWYHLWVIYNPTTDTWAGLLSISSTAPTLPSGYTKKGYVGAIYNDGSSNLISIYQIGKRVNRSYTQALADGTATSYTEVSLAAIIPTTAKLITGIATANVLNKQSFIAGSAAGLGVSVLYLQGANGMYSFMFCSIIESQKVYYKVDSGGQCSIFVSAWEYES